MYMCVLLAYQVLCCCADLTVEANSIQLMWFVAQGGGLSAAAAAM